MVESDPRFSEVHILQPSLCALRYSEEPAVEDAAAAAAGADAKPAVAAAPGAEKAPSSKAGQVSGLSQPA